MRISVTIFVILISTCIVNASVLDPVIENIVHLKATKPPGEVGGIWRKKTIWKPRWVKEWKSAKITKPVWRKVWSPIQIREWLPIPKPPPGWDTASTPLALAHSKPHKAPLKDSQGHDSFPVHSATTLPLWDPVPYPESQQPPPPPPNPPQPLQNTDPCSKGGCDNTPAHTFNHQQILEILGPRYQQQPDYYQNPEYSETVNYMTRLPPEGNNWRPPQPLPDNQFDNRFNAFQALPEFLIPPKTQLGNDFPPLIPNNTPVVNNPPIQTQNPRWIPLPPENKAKGHSTTKEQDQPYKFEFPETRNTNNQTKSKVENEKDKVKPISQVQNNGFRPPVDGDFIQEAQLVGEYHYSEFDFPNVKLGSHKQEPILQEQEKDQQQIKTTEQQRPAINQQPLIMTKQQPTQNDIRQQQLQRPEVTNKPQYISNDIRQQQLQRPVGTNKPQPVQKDIKQQQLPRPVVHQQPVVTNKQKPIQKEIKQQQLQRPVVHQQPAVGNKQHQVQKDVKQQQLQRPVLHQQPVVEHKPKPIQKEVHPQSTSHIHKKHIPTTPSQSNLNFQQQEALIKEIFPIFKPLPNHQTNLNHTEPSNHRFELPANNKIQENHSSTRLLPVTTNSQSNSSISQQLKQTYPVFEKPQGLNPNTFPPNHKFAFNSEVKQQEKSIQSNQNSTKLVPVSKPENPIFDKANTVQLVFATAPDDQSELIKESQKSTTTEKYEVIFSSSLLSTTEAVTKSPVFIVTPVSSASEL